VESAPKIMHMIQEVAGRHFAKLPTWARISACLAGSLGRYEFRTHRIMDLRLTQKSFFSE
ncbi:MAG: hypothetical protein OXN84_11565, partial [Albidovulum sp.]|nr:hypothetical protein [Albidovulum sp.]